MNSRGNHQKMHHAYMRSKAGLAVMVCILAVAACLNAHAQTTDWKWVVGAGGDRFDEATGITLDQDDNIYITGNFRETGVFGDTTLTFEGNNAHLFISKLDNDGNWLWTHGAKSSGADSRAVEVDDEGNVYLAGHFYRDITINDTTHTGPRDLGFNIFVAKMDSDGNWLWVRLAYSEGLAPGRSIVVDSQGNSYITGHFVLNFLLGEIHLDPDDHLFKTFLAKLDHEGNWVWATYVDGSGPSEGWGIGLDGDEHVYVTGKFTENAVFGTHELHAAHSTNSMIFIAKADSSGNWLWADRAGGSLDNNHGKSVVVDQDENIYLTGYAGRNASFGDHVHPGFGSASIFLAKMRVADRETSAETLLELPSGYKLHQNYPNPFNPVTNIGYSLPESGPVSLVLYNTLGQQVARLVDGSAEAGYHEVHFDAADLSSGIYIYRLEAGDFRANRKLLIIK